MISSASVMRRDHLGVWLAIMLVVMPGCAPPPNYLPPLSPGQPRLIAHALGGIDGVTYSNSLEAFLANYRAGKRWFEVDLALTVEGNLVCFHEGHERAIGLTHPIGVATTPEFSRCRYAHHYTLMTFRQFLMHADTLDDVVLITDTKRWTPTILQAFCHDLESARPSRVRVIPQIYQPADLELFERNPCAVDAFQQIILTLYQNRMSDDAVVSFVRSHKMMAVTMSTSRFRETLARRVGALGVLVFVHTVNDPREIQRLLRAGVDGFYTDWYPARAADQR